MLASGGNPEILKEYGSKMSAWDRDLLERSYHLVYLLADVQARCSEYSVDVGHLAPALQGHARHADEIDRWIYEVGVQFEIVDSGGLSANQFDFSHIDNLLVDLSEWRQFLLAAIATPLLVASIRAGNTYPGQVIINLPNAVAELGISLRSVREWAGLSSHLTHIKYTNLPGHIGRIGLIASIPFLAMDWYNDVHNYKGTELASAMAVDTVLTLVPAGAGWVGAEGGMWLGAAIGTAIFPGVGTAVGGAAGAIIGGIGLSMATSWAIDKYGVREPAIEWVDKQVMQPVVDFATRSYERVSVRIAEDIDRIGTQVGAFRDDVVAGAQHVMDRIRTIGMDAGQQISQSFQHVVEQGHALTESIGSRLNAWSDSIEKGVTRTVEIGRAVWDDANTYVRSGGLQADAEALLAKWQRQLDHGFQAFKSDVSSVWNEYGSGAWESIKGEFDKRMNLAYFTKYSVGFMINPAAAGLIADMLPGKDWMWSVGGEMAIGMIPIIGDGKDIVAQEWNRHTGGEVDELVFTIAKLGLIADLVAMGDSPIPGPADAPNAAVGALKGLAKQIPAGPARDALREVVEKAAKNPEEFKTLTDAVMSLMKNHRALSALSQSPEALVVALKNGPEAIELAAKYGDDAARIFADYGDDGFDLLRTHGNHVLDKGADAFLDASTHLSDDFVKFGDLVPNKVYINNGYAHSTDALGRVDRVSGQLKLDEGIRTGHTTEVGHLGLEGDQGGHLIGVQFGGAPDGFNLIPQNGNLNQSAWKKMENYWANSLAEGKQVYVDIQPKYLSPESVRPDTFEVLYKIDGEGEFVQIFKNMPGG